MFGNEETSCYYVLKISYFFCSQRKQFKKNRNHLTLKIFNDSEIYKFFLIKYNINKLYFLTKPKKLG